MVFKNPYSPRNPQANDIIEIIHQVLVNLVYTYNLQETYVEESDPWIGILAAYAFAIKCMYHSTKDKSTYQLFFIQDTNLQINHVADWRYIHQRKQVKIEKYAIHKNSTKIENDYKFGDQIMLRNKAAYKYKTPFRGPCEIDQIRTNGIVTLQMGAATTRINIHHIKNYHKLNA